MKILSPSLYYTITGNFRFYNNYQDGALLDIATNSTTCKKVSSVGSCLFHSVPGRHCLAYLVDIIDMLISKQCWYWSSSGQKSYYTHINLCTAYTGKEFAKFVIYKKLFPSRTTITILRVATLTCIHNKGCVQCYFPCRSVMKSRMRRMDNLSKLIFDLNGHSYKCLFTSAVVVVPHHRDRNLHKYKLL